MKLDSRTVSMIEDRIKTRHISARRHRMCDLTILNYTAVTQYEYAWDDATMLCRGLIVDSEWNVVSRPFRKFFNLGEDPSFSPPAGPFSVTEKVDGSLGIMYVDHDGSPSIASRGSFESDQASVGTKILRDRYLDAARAVPAGTTLLFEIVYPENRIVVDYGDTSDLFLLAAIDNDTGRDVETPCGFRNVRSYDVSSIDDLTSVPGGLDFEGYVVRFSDGTRKKIKCDGYVELHRIITNMTDRVLLQELAKGRSVDDIVSSLPESIRAWSRETAESLVAERDRILDGARSEFRRILIESGPCRKTFASLAKQTHDPSTLPILFNMLDGRSSDDIVWKRLRSTVAGLKPAIKE